MKVPPTTIMLPTWASANVIAVVTADGAASGTDPPSVAGVAARTGAGGTVAAAAAIGAATVRRARSRCCSRTSSRRCSAGSRIS